MAVARARKTKSRQQPLPPDMLAGRLVRLRPLRAADRITSVRWRNDPDIRDNVLGYRFPITEAMEADWVDAVLKDQSRTRVVLAIEDKTDGALVGFVYLNNIDWFARNAEFGILIGERSRHGKGLAKEALALVADYAFETLNLHKLYLRVVAFNKRALTLYRAFGFAEEGIQRQQAFVRGRYYDVVLMGLIRGPGRHPS
jgi:UDP-4-amino-4,6-dideoxy-N-acetyl-beta-L-altrosamine N-acetyltransferase